MRLVAANFGQIVPDPSHALNIGGMPVQTDPVLLEKQQNFNRMKVRLLECFCQVAMSSRLSGSLRVTQILERIVHPCGSSAFGKFKMTADISHLTRAAFMQPGVVTPTTTRFSTGEVIGLAIATMTVR